MLDTVRHLDRLDSALRPHAVVKRVSVENSVQASRGSDGLVGVLVKDGPYSASVCLTPTEARHLASVLIELANGAADGG